MNTIYQKCIFLLIILLALLLRFWNLSSIPPSLSHDEVAIGYNAWSILQTGKDEYGTKLPMLFRSFDDFKLPGYIYSTAVVENIFGLTPFAVRFTSAFLGSLTVIAFYFFVLEVFKKIYSLGNKSLSLTSNPSQARLAKTPTNRASGTSKKTSYLVSAQLERIKGRVLFDPQTIALLSAFMFAISPWHVNFSRAAFEANGSLFFIVMGVYLLLKSLSKPWLSILSAISFVFSLYFYYTARILVPAILIIIFLINRNKLLQTKKWFGLGLVIGLVLLLPLLPYVFTSGTARIDQVSIFQDKTLSDTYTSAYVKHPNFLTNLVYNRRWGFIQTFFDNYLKDFATDFYFTNGTGPMGLLYLWEIPFLFLGLYGIFELPSKWKWIFITWFFAVPIVGGLTTGQPNALRTLANAPIPALFTALGLSTFFRRKFVYSVIIKSIVILLIFFFFIRFLFLYFDYYPPLSAYNWGDGHKQLAAYILTVKKDYQNIYITGDYWRPYIYMLFYMQYPPRLYQVNGTKDGFANLHFGKAGWDKGDEEVFATSDFSRFKNKNILIVLSKKDYEKQQEMIASKEKNYTLQVEKEINGKFFTDAFYAVKVEYPKQLN